MSAGMVGHGSLQLSKTRRRSFKLRIPSSRQAQSAKSANLFSLRVRLEETGETYRLSNCHVDTTIRELKEELDLIAGIPFHFQRLLYLDQGILMDDSTLGFYDFVPGGIISMCLWHQDGWQELALAAFEGDISKISCLGVTEDSLYRTAHSLHLKAEKFKTWIADRAFVALYITSHRGHIEAVRFLLENGASCLAKTPVGRTALHVAAAMGRVGCLELLLEYGSSFIEKDLKGESPLDIARRFKYLEVFLTEEENLIHLLENGPCSKIYSQLLKLPAESTVGSVNIQIIQFLKFLNAINNVVYVTFLNFRRP